MVLNVAIVVVLGGQVNSNPVIPRLCGSFTSVVGSVVLWGELLANPLLTDCLLYKAIHGLAARIFSFLFVRDSKWVGQSACAGHCDH